MTVGFLNLAATHRFTKAETVPSCVFDIQASTRNDDVWCKDESVGLAGRLLDS